MMSVSTRWQAFAVHLAISIVLLLVLLAVIFFYWFPYDLIYAGGISGLKILLGVDLVLGPLLTLIVFRAGKKGLALDLAAIGFLQLACLSAGLWMIYNERPLAQVLMDDGVHLLAASDYKYHSITLPDLPGAHPKNVLMDLPEDQGEISSIKLMSEIVEEKPFAFRTDLYRAMSEVDQNRFESRMESISKLYASDTQLAPELRAASANSNSNKLGCHWIPVHSKHVSGHACFNKENGVVQLSEKAF